MGIPPFLIASTLNVSVAQRLVRKLCPQCKEEQTIAKNLFPSTFDPPKDLNKHFVSVGCDSCYHTGYSGRKAIYEIIPITKPLIQFIKQNQLEIDQYLAEHNIPTLKANAINLLKEGVTSVEEVYALLSE
jgi:type IV pilus assembly protein PilB